KKKKKKKVGSASIWQRTVRNDSPVHQFMVVLLLSFGGSDIKGSCNFVHTSRGGLITFHGPGQLVCYPVLNLGCFRKSVRWYVCELERTVIKTCGQFGIEASTSPDTGVWAGDNKICAIGIHCGRYITSHGLALNCNTDMSWFDNIVPCGIMELGRDVPTEEAVPKLLEAFTEQFNCTLIYN
uniref:lipoyl(octanoyl) transferase n=1 Tax=Cyprinus carpio TaxID=7962 RepID=A0A8C2AMR8_CYPCA